MESAYVAIKDLESGIIFNRGELYHAQNLKALENH